MLFSNYRLENINDFTISEDEQNINIPINNSPAEKKQRFLYMELYYDILLRNKFGISINK